MWSDARALFYWFWHRKPGPAPEIRARSVLVEWVRMRGVPLRLSHALAYQEADARADSALVEQYDYEERRALFVGEHAPWADGRFPEELGRASAEQVGWDDDRPSHDHGVAALRADPASKIRVPDSVRRRWRFIAATAGRPRLFAVFGSERPDDEVLEYYAEALRTLGWDEAPYRPRTQAGRDPGDPWAHDVGGREWRRDEWNFTVFLLGGQDRMIYDLTPARSAFEIWLEGPSYPL